MTTPDASTPLSEAERLAVLDECRILDTPAERGFDDITRLAASITCSPIALVSLVDANRQWFKSRVGTDTTETPREHAFCHHAILEPGVMTVEDAELDPRFAANPLVLKEPHIRFYAGAPLLVDGAALGTLCVIDREPRELGRRQRSQLESLARLVVDQIELHRKGHRLSDSLDRVRLLQELLPLCAGCFRVREDDGYLRRVDVYLRDHMGALVTHGLCPACAERSLSS